MLPMTFFSPPTKSSVGCLELAAVAEDVHRSGRGGHLPGVDLGALLGDEVEHDVAALAVGQVLDGVDVAAVGEHGLVGADLLGQRERVGVAVDDDDARAGDRRERLDRDVAEAARALHDGGGARVESGHGLAHGVVGGDARVGQRGDVGGVGARVELDARAGGGAQVLGHAAVVARQAREEGVLALHVAAAPARQAQPAGGLRVQDHRVADRDVGDAVADRVHPARVLVADHVGQRRVHRLGPVAVDDVQVGAAHAGATDLHDDVERTLERGLRDVVDLGILVVRVYPDGLHRGTSSTSGGCARFQCEVPRLTTGSIPHGEKIG